MLDYKNNILHVEGVNIKALAAAYGTPLYVYSADKIKENFYSIENAFKNYNHLVCYAVKANNNISICKVIASLGKNVGADVVSGGELYKALISGFEPKKIIFSGVGKTDDEIKYAVREKILLLNVESEEEFIRVAEIARRCRSTVSVSFRINFDIQVDTHKHINTAHRGSKFGLSPEDAIPLYIKAKSSTNLLPIGIHTHLGSQLSTAEPYVKAIKKLNDVVRKLESSGINVKYIDMGGGFGIKYKKPQEALDMNILEKSLRPYLKKFTAENKTIILEPGRYIIGSAGVLVTRVLYTKESYNKKFIIVDAGMNDIIRPALYDAYHEIIPVEKRIHARKVYYDIVGPICESGDYIGSGRLLQETFRGDLLCVLNAGAYCMSMASNYNSRLRAAEVLVEGAKEVLIRKRESYKDLVIKETIKEKKISCENKIL